MVLPIVTYGHPVLRQKGAPVQSSDPGIQDLIQNMFDTMYDKAGIGLAAQQVGRALQLAIIDLREVTDRPSTMEIDGAQVNVADHMPLVLINPKIQPAGRRGPASEGCLSFPELYGDVIRPESVSVTAENREGQTYHFKATGLLSRAVQHEVDHLNGILFIDRMSAQSKEELRPELEALQQSTKDLLAQSKTA